MAFATIGMTFACIVTLEKEMIKVVGQSRIQVLNQVSERLRIIVDNMRTISNLYYNDPSVREIVFNSTPLSYDTVKHLYQLDLKYEFSFKPSLKYYLALVTKSGNGYYSQTSGGDPSIFILNDPRQTDWYNKAIEKKGEVLWITSYNISKDDQQPQYTFSTAQSIYNPRSGEYSGMIIVSARERDLYGTYSDLLDQQNTIYILDEDHYMITHPDQGRLGEYVQRPERTAEISGVPYAVNSDVLVSTYQDPYTGWLIVDEIPLKVVYQPILRVRFSIWIFFMADLLVSFFIAVIFSRRTVRPLNILCAEIERVGSGSLEPIALIESWPELHKINQVVNQMIITVKELLADLKEKEKIKRRMQVDMLKAQINPHFIYNTLFTIKCMVMMRKNYEAEKMLEEFIRLIKSVMSNVEGKPIDLRVELSNVDQYIKIQNLMANDKFSWHIYADRAAEEGKITPMLIQPLVENALFHGIGPCEHFCKLIIFVKKRRERLIVEVFDNGVGMDDNIKANIWSIHEDKPSGSHIGLKNVQDRLKLLYGDGYGLNIYSREGKWTKSVIIVPFLS